MQTAEISWQTINTLRTLSIDMVEQANSGHPGLPLGAAPTAYVLYRNFLKFDPSAPDWADRDRFVLSAGHGSALLYALLHVAGFDLSLDELRKFRQWGSLTPGHPEYRHTPGVEATTGPLGQGVANAVGMALAERYLARLYNRPGHEVVDHRVWTLVGDGDLMEGVAQEALALAGHWQLEKLCVIYDSNDVTLDGPARLILSEDVAARFVAAGWHVEVVANADTDLVALRAAMESATRQRKPTLLIAKTTIGFGSPKKAGSCAAHGSPLGASEVSATKAALQWPHAEPFFVPEAAKWDLQSAADEGRRRHAQWRERFAAWSQAFPELRAMWDRGANGTLPDQWASAITFADGAKLATRTSSGTILAELAKLAPWLLGGDADLGGSTKTIVAGGDFSGNEGRNLRFGVREHAMGAIANGLLYHGGLRAYSATFFVFSDYLRPAVRLAALSKLGQVFVWTHDSVGVGEDGPTHQPVEHLASLRAMPGLRVFRPGDARESLAGWQVAMRDASTPLALVLSRQDLPVVTPSDTSLAMRGGYVLHEPAGAPQVILLATGSELVVALEAATKLASEGMAARVVSMPCWELFFEQPAEYREQVLPSALTARVSVEAGSTMGWERFVGLQGEAIGIGIASAPRLPGRRSLRSSASRCKLSSTPPSASCAPK